MLTFKPSVLKELKRIALDESPKEAVGLIDGVGNIYQLTNNHPEPESNFAINKADLISLVELNQLVVLTELTLWHSHPGGGIGPSRFDLQNKTPFKYHLVVSLIDDDIKLTWY